MMITDPKSAIEIWKAVFLSMGIAIGSVGALTICFMAYWAWKDAHDVRLPKPTEPHIH